MDAKHIDFEHNGRTYRRRFSDNPVWLEKTDDGEFSPVGGRTAVLLEDKMNKNWGQVA